MLNIMTTLSSSTDDLEDSEDSEDSDNDVEHLLPNIPMGETSFDRILSRMRRENGYNAHGNNTFQQPSGLSINGNTTSSSSSSSSIHSNNASLGEEIDNTNIMFAFPSPIYQKDKEVFYIEFFKEFIGSGVTSLLMDELREKNQWIYSVSLDNYTNPYGTYLTINISTENKYIEKVVIATIKILKKLSRGELDPHYLEYVKNRYMVYHYDTCETTSFLTQFYGDQYINQIYNGENQPIIKLNVLYRCGKK